MAKKHKQRRKYTGEFRERSFKEQETLRLHFRQDHEDEYDDEEHDTEDAEVVEGLGDEKTKDKHMDNKLSSHKARRGSDRNLGYFRETKRRKIEETQPWKRGRDVGY